MDEPLDELHRDATTSLDQHSQTPRRNERMQSMHPQGWNLSHIAVGCRFPARARGQRGSRCRRSNFPLVADAFIPKSNWNFSATLLHRGTPACTSNWVPPTATNRFSAYRYNWCHARGARSSTVIDRNPDVAPGVAEGLVIGGIPFSGAPREQMEGLIT